MLPWKGFWIFCSCDVWTRQNHMLWGQTGSLRRSDQFYATADSTSATCKQLHCTETKYTRCWWLGMESSTTLISLAYKLVTITISAVQGCFLAANPQGDNYTHPSHHNAPHTRSGSVRLSGNYHEKDHSSWSDGGNMKARGEPKPLPWQPSVHRLEEAAGNSILICMAEVCNEKMQFPALNLDYVTLLQLN